MCGGKVCLRVLSLMASLLQSRQPLHSMLAAVITHHTNAASIKRLLSVQHAPAACSPRHNLGLTQALHGRASHPCCI